MRIGTDISIQCCRDEGYMVMDYPAIKFRRDPKNTICTFTRSMPADCRVGFVGEKIIILKEEYSYEDLWEMYLENKDSIDSFVGYTREYSDHPTPLDVLCLGDDIDAPWG